MTIPTTTLTVPAFQAKWGRAALKERSAAHEHFVDLCRLFGAPTPAEGDPTGTTYAFEKGAGKSTGGQGWADVWRRNYFAWEYKGPHADLDDAYRQLQLYLDDLENPPLLVVCDLDRFVIRTHFTGTPTETYRFDLAGLSQPDNLRVLRSVFTEPRALRPKRTVAAVTEDAATRFAALAAGLHDRGVAPHRAAHLLVQLLFCLYAEDAGLLPKRLFSDLLAYCADHPDEFPAQIEALLRAMRDGGSVAFRRIDRFNGGLFAEIGVEALTGAELRELSSAANLDWGSIEPAIFGTLFERSLDPAKRAQLGAHYTARADIERVVEPVVLAPLRRRWAEVRAEADRRRDAWQAATDAGDRTKKRQAFAGALLGFQDELAAVRILDPACGSGNFLYVALAALKELEKEVIAYGASSGLPVMLPRVGPKQLAALEVNDYARELAQVVVWIGYLQWMSANGFQVNRDPVLEPLQTIRLQDALLDLTDPDHPKEAVWPDADFIIGNPPFLGDKRLRTELGSQYVEALFTVYKNRLPGQSDLCCYFFEKARAQIEGGRAKRAGLLATQSIRMGASRRVLERIKATGDIFMAWDDEPWVLDGADVRIAIVGFDDGSESKRMLDGQPTGPINADLTSGVNLTTASTLPENRRIVFQGPVKVGSFEIEAAVAVAMLASPINPNGRPNLDVIRPWVNGTDIVGRPRGMHIIDFGVMSLEAASLYEAPFEWVREHVKPEREGNRRQRRAQYWWHHGETGEGLRHAIESLQRYLVTPRVAKHRLFVWVPAATLPDSRVFAFARQDDYFFGVLQSRAHEVWSLRLASRHGVGNDPTYNATTCFETFPLPWPPGREPWRDERLHAIANAARRLDDLRRAWLDPPGAAPDVLKKRTLTNLYNERPAWLAQAHAALDRAVWAAYGWDDAEPAATSDETILARLLDLNETRSTG